ncbi:MAG: NAD-dependent epimerase/dehydratase family protein [Beijerinckiaceae bacterium]
MTNPLWSGDGRRIVVVGGAGFVGCNLAHSFARSGAPVRVLDNLSRRGAEQNLDWLKRTHGERVDVRIADIRDATALHTALDGAGAVLHMAAQVAVTTSIHDPRADFDVNATGTLNILEWARTRSSGTPIIFASTNKVYGCLENIQVSTTRNRHEPDDAQFASKGITETQPLDLRTPYGCSKGAADQYVLDYAKSFGLRTAVMRMSCIYGPRQFGNEDQGWVAHFALCALRGEPITIYGDGAQVRDVLHVDDAVAAYRAVLANFDLAKGEAFNLGGGRANAVSLLELIDALRARTGKAVSIRRAAWRTGDQPWFVADTSKLSNRLGWRPQIAWRDGINDLLRWLNDGAMNGPDARRPKGDDLASGVAMPQRRSA